MMYLCIDRTKVQPITAVVERGGQCIGTTRLLDWRDLPAYARFLGLFGGRELLDAFELRLINDGMLFIWPIDDEGEPLFDECDATEIRRYDDGSRIVWQARLKCQICCGDGHFGQPGDEITDEDLCPNCDGTGEITGEEFETDMDGRPLPSTAQQAPR